MRPLLSRSPTDSRSLPVFSIRACPRDIPQDEGVAGLRLELLRLGTTARLMQVVAHPDDEDGGLLTLEARGHGVSTLLMTLNRGEGGQNKIGSNLSDVLGVLRTEELLASDQHYGVQDRFSRVADFGFSKNRRRNFRQMGRPRRRSRRHGSRHSDFSSRCAGRAFLRHRARWPWKPSGIGHSDEGSVSRCGRSKTLSRADCARPRALAGQEALHRKRLRLWRDDLPRRRTGP